MYGKIFLSSKPLLIACFIILSGVYVASARVQGPCSDCHTMHNTDSSGVVANAGGPRLALLKADCVGCHTNSSGNTTIVTLGGGARVPIVNTSSAPTYPPDGSATSALAGGNFYWVADAGGNDDSKGHNVYGISGEDAALSPPDMAPGAHPDANCSPCHDTLAAAGAGCEGCHHPRHHADDSATVVEATGGWYRFLGAVMWREFGVYPDIGQSINFGAKGIEDANWEQNPSSSAHNGYNGTSVLYDKVAFAYMPNYSITEKCTGCHGDFHHHMHIDPSTSLTSEDWFLHPSDVEIPDSGEYASYTTYNPMAPVAKQNIAAGDQNTTAVERGAGGDVVMCLSCHRAHGSPYPDMLRWNYDSMNLGEGCFICHTTKDD